MSIFRKNLEENTIPALIVSVIYGLVMYWCNSTTPLTDGLLFFIGYMTSSYFITKIRSNPDKKKADKNMMKYSLWVLGISVILIVLISII